MTNEQASKIIALLTAIDSKLQTLVGPIGPLQTGHRQPAGPREFSQDEIERRSHRFYQPGNAGAMRDHKSIPERY